MRIFAFMRCCPRCIATSVNEFVFAPNGDVYSCISGLGDEEFLISKYEEYSKNPGTLVVKQAMQKGDRRTDGCATCANYPICNGGCTYNMIMEKKKTSCQKAEFSINMDYYMRIIAISEEIAPDIFRIRRDT